MTERAIEIEPLSAVPFWRRHGELIALNLLCLGSLLPFLSKPFHIDDPLYLWTAQHARQHPLDPYGFGVNWYGWWQPMSRVINNPPLVPYYLALWSMISWREELLHAAMLLPALGLATGVYLLARRLCPAHPFAASAATVLAPATLVSATTLMVDVTMLCFFVWSVYAWVRGIDERRTWLLAIAALLAGLSALSKYFGVSLIPLLATYATLRWQHVGVRILLSRVLPLLLIPAFALLGFQVWTKALYGQGMLSFAAGYAVQLRWGWGVTLLAKALASLAFVGGLFATVVAIVLRTGGRGTITTFVMTMIAVVVVNFLLQPFTSASGASQVTSGGWFVCQLGVFAAGGVVLLSAVARTWWGQWRDADVALLAMWVGGTLVFATLVNWTTNARALLPVAPAAAMLLLRPAGSGRPTRAFGRAALATAIAVGAALACCAAWADYSLARSARRAADTFAVRLKDERGTRWQVGHWGFQWYLLRQGFRSIDVSDTVLMPGDRVAVPRNNTNVLRLPESVRPAAAFEMPTVPFVTIMNRRTGAGFYSDVWGPLPFALGPAPAEEYREDIVTQHTILRRREE